MSQPKIFCICLVKNEADIVGYCLQEASKWADRIIVYDGESTDGTWGKVLALQSEKIVPWKSEDKVFNEGLRAEAFNAFRHEANEGDWWCRLDADEIYIQNPRQFLAPIRKPVHVVWGVAIEYAITTEDLETIDFTTPADKLLPQLRYYRACNSEPRFFRYRPRLVWPETASWPIHLGPVHPQRILYRHYKYRSPEQIRARLGTRQSAIRRGALAKEYLLTQDWREKIGLRSDHFLDTGDGTYVIEEAKLPKHRGTWPSRALKWWLHQSRIWP